MITPDEIIRSKRKTLSISIDTANRLIVRAPLRCSDAQIAMFLAEKEGWILRKKREREGAGICLPSENLEGYELLLLGVKCKIHVFPISKVGYYEGKHCLYLPEKDTEERLVKWLKKNAKRIFTNVTEQTAKRMGVTYRSVQVTSARSRWGSCSGNDALHYSFRLLYAPKEVIEYVIVHELAHTLEKNHSKNFWAIVERYIPDYKQKRAWLKKHAWLMEVF